MSKLLDAVRSKTRNISCSKHNEKAEITMTGDKINFKCCCDEFQKKIADVSGKAAQEFAQNEIKNMLKKFK
jgi:hypothetical protein